MKTIKRYAICVSCAYTAFALLSTFMHPFFAGFFSGFVFMTWYDLTKEAQ